MVQDDAILSALKLVTTDEDDQVRKTATEVLAKVEKYPTWNPYLE